MSINRRSLLSALAFSVIVTPQAFAQEESPGGGQQARKATRAKQPATKSMKQPKSKQKPAAMPEPIPTPQKPASSPVPQPVPQPK